MAKKQRRTNTGAAAIGTLLTTIGKVAAIELKDDPEALADVNKMVDDVKDSNIITAAEVQDDAIEAMHDREDAAEEAEAAEAAEQAEEQPTE